MNEEVKENENANTAKIPQTERRQINVNGKVIISFMRLCNQRQEIKRVVLNKIPKPYPIRSDKYVRIRTRNFNLDIKGIKQDGNYTRGN